MPACSKNPSEQSGGFDLKVELLDGEMPVLPGHEGSSFPLSCSGPQGLQLLKDLSDLDVLYSGTDDTVLAKISVKAKGYDLPLITYVQLGSGRLSGAGSVVGGLFSLFTAQENRALDELKNKGANSRTFYYETLFLNRRPDVNEVIKTHLKQKEEIRRFCVGLDQFEKQCRRRGLLKDLFAAQNFILINKSANAASGLTAAEFSQKLSCWTKALAPVQAHVAAETDLAAVITVPDGMLPFADQILSENFGFDLDEKCVAYAADLKNYRSAVRQRERDLQLIRQEDLTRQMTEAASRLVSSNF